MSIEDPRDRLAWVVMVGLILGSGAAVNAQDFEVTAPDDVLIWHDALPREANRVTVRLSDYWLGVSGDAAEPALRSQLKLADGQGFLVSAVQDDSPAAKAKIEKFDILLLVDGKNVGDLKDLASVVDTNKDKEVELTLLRGGEKRTVKLTPVKRPEAKPVAADGLDPQEMDRWLDLMPGRGGRVQLFNFGPGKLVDHFAFFDRTPVFPADLGVTIEKQGNAPAKVVVKRGDQEWTTTDDKLESLPEDVRGHVATLLGRPPVGPQVNTWEMAAPQPVVPGPRMRIQALPRMDRLQMRGQALNERLEELTEQLDDLRRSVDELRDAAKSEENGKPRDK